MAFQSRMTSKGQVTVPLEIRRKLGLKKGDRVEFAEKGSDTVLRRAPHAENPFDRYKGIFKKLDWDVADINRWVAEMREEEEEDSR